MRILSSKLKWMCMLAVAAIASQVHAEEQLVLKARMDKVNYAIGVDIVRMLKQRGGEINLDVVIQGMKDEVTGENRLLADDDIREIMFALKTELKPASPVPAAKEPDSRTMVASQTDPKQKVGCAVIDYPGHYKAVCTNEALQALALSQTTPAREQKAQTPIREHMGEQGAFVQEQPVVEEQTFVALLATQEQAQADGNIGIELNALTRRQGEHWLKTQPHRY